MSCPSACEFLEIILIILLPPLGLLVSGLEKNIAGKRLATDTVINLILTILFYIPGLVHGLWAHSTYQNEVFHEIFNTSTINSKRTINYEKHQIMSCPSLCNCLEILLIIVLPPLGVAVSGSQKMIAPPKLCVDTALNLLLTILGYFPGLIHGLWTHSAYQE